MPVANYHPPMHPALKFWLKVAFIAAIATLGGMLLAMIR